MSSDAGIVQGGIAFAVRVNVTVPDVISSTPGM